MGAGGCVGIFEGVSLQCDRVTLWTFGGRRLPFGAGLVWGWLVWEGGTEADGRYGSPLAMDEEVVGDYKIGEWAGGVEEKDMDEG